VRKLIAQCLLLGVSLASAHCTSPDAQGNLVPATVDEQVTLPQLQFNGSNFHLQTFGDEHNPTLIFLHGGPGLDHRGLLELRNQVNGEQLEDKYFLVFWDQRGSGLSRRLDPSELGLEAYLADLKYLVEHFNHGKKVGLIGHSWGGMYGAQFLGRHPEQVAGAVFMEPGPLTQSIFDKLEGDISIFGEEENDFSWSERFFTAGSHARVDYQAALAQMGDPNATFWRLGAVAGKTLQSSFLEQWPPFSEGLDQFEGPVLIEGGTDSQLGFEFQKQQLVFFKHAQLEEIRGAEHDFPWVAWQQALKPMFPFLEALAF
jgi:proline iminopeptidase